MFSSRLFIAAIAAFSLTAFASECSRTYTVVEGDTCDSISAAHNSSSYQLAVVNSDTINGLCSNLMPAQQICLGTQGEDCTNTYVVQAGDTCDSITAVFNINATMLYTNNPQINSGCTNIYVGQVLCTSTTVLVPPPPGNWQTGVVSIAPGTATAAPPSQQTPATGNGEDDLPECDDPNDDGEW